MNDNVSILVYFILFHFSAKRLGKLTFRVFHTHSASAQHPVSLNKDRLKNTLSNWQSAQNKANKK